MVPGSGERCHKVARSRRSRGCAATPRPRSRSWTWRAGPRGAASPAPGAAWSWPRPGPSSPPRSRTRPPPRRTAAARPRAPRRPPPRPPRPPGPSLRSGTRWCPPRGCRGRSLHYYGHIYILKHFARVTQNKIIVPCAYLQNLCCPPVDLVQVLLRSLVLLYFDLSEICQHFVDVRFDLC